MVEMNKPKTKDSMNPSDGKGSYRPPPTRGTQAEADRLRAVLMDIVMKHRAQNQPFRGRDAESDRLNKRAEKYDDVAKTVLQGMCGR